MLKLCAKVTLILAVILALLLLAMWAMHGFQPLRSQQQAAPKSSLVVSAQTEHKLAQFLADPALPRVIEQCVPAYNAEFRRLNPTEKNLPDLIQARDFSADYLLQTLPGSAEKQLNQYQVTKLNDFLNSLDHPLGDHTLLAQCMGADGLADYRRLKGKFSAVLKSDVGLD